MYNSDEHQLSIKPVTVEYVQEKLGAPGKPKSKWWVYQMIRQGKLTPIGLSKRPIILDKAQVDKLAIQPQAQLGTPQSSLKTKKKKQVTHQRIYQSKKENLWE